MERFIIKLILLAQCSFIAHYGSSSNG